MSKIDISFEETGAKGRYIAAVEGFHEPADLTFSRAGETRIIVDHTGVPESLRGQGVGAALAARVVEDARAQGLTIVPLCPFFKAQATRHPEWADVVQGLS
ncbi:MAG: GNAT family N-acetyltransferase [Pseudomonadota bacterium]